MSPSLPIRELALAAALAVAALPAAQAATQQQQWSADWTLIDGHSNAVIPGSASGSGGGGTLSVNATMPKGSWVSGDMSLDFDPATGALRSGTDVDARINAIGSPDTQSFQTFHFEASNRLSFTDLLTVGAGGWGTLKVTVQVNGQVSHNAQISSPPYAFSILDLNNELQVGATLEGGGAGSAGVSIDSHLEGISDGRFSRSDGASLNDQFTLIVPWTSGTPLAFDFWYDETLSFDMQYLDAEAVDFSGINDFGHTLELFASVYDANGVLMEGVTVLSSEGITYAALAPVPEPSTWLLLSAGLAGLLHWRRSSDKARAT